MLVPDRLTAKVTVKRGGEASKTLQIHSLERTLMISDDRVEVTGSDPKSLTVTLANLVYFEEAELSQPSSNRLIRTMGYSIRADVDPAGTVAAGLPLSLALQTRNRH